MKNEGDEKRIADIDVLWRKIFECYRNIPEAERAVEGVANHCYNMAINGINQIAKDHPVGGL